jgi:hypothetical protein
MDPDMAPGTGLPGWDFPHADTTELRREAELLKIRVVALSTVLASNRMDRLL